MTDESNMRIAGFIVAVIAIFVNYFVGKFTWGIFNSPLMSLTIGSAIISFILGVIGLIVFLVVCVIALVGIYALLTGESF